MSQRNTNPNNFLYRSQAHFHQHSPAQNTLYSFQHLRAQQRNQLNVPLPPSYEKNSQASNQNDIFKSIKDFIYHLSSQKNSRNDKLYDQNLERQLQHTKMVTSLNHQLNYYKDIATTQDRKIKQSQQNWQKTAKENQNKHRKEIKKYIDLLNQKQLQVQNLKKTLKTLNNKALSLTNQVETLTQTKVNLENTILKSIQGVKSNIKQFNYSLQQNELDKVVLEGKYRQLCDKVEQVMKQCQDSQNQKNKIEKKYEKLKQSYENCRNQCIELKFQIQRGKIRIKDLLDITQGRKKNIFSKMNKNQRSQQELKISQSKQSLGLIKEKTIQIISKFRSIQQRQNQLNNVQNLIQKIEQLTKQNEDLKIDLKQKQIQIDQQQLKSQGPIYEDQILQNRNPSLYQILTQKKSNIENLQAKIEQIQKIAQRAEELLQKRNHPVPVNDVVTESIGVSFPESGCKNNFNANKGNLMEQFKIQKQKALAKQRQHYEKLRQKDKNSIKFLEQTNMILKKQVEKLRKDRQEMQRNMRRSKALIQQLEQNQNKKKKTGKTKQKIRCDICSSEITGTGKSSKCPECDLVAHGQCLKKHECAQARNEERGDDQNQE